MLALKVPGRRTGLIYLWAIALGPMLLFAAGVFLLLMGFWRDAESVSAIGAIGIVASLILPRMQGEFEIGAGGIKGALEGEIFREVIKKARESGVGAEQAIELAAGAAGQPGPTSPTSPDPSAASRSRLVNTLVNEFIGESVRLGRETTAIVERVAGEKGWDVRPGWRRIGPGGVPFVFDFTIGTDRGLIFVETVNFRERQALYDKVAAVSAALPDQNFRRAFLVIPNTKATAAYVPENLSIVPVGDLERKLRKIAEENQAGPGGEPNA